MRLLSDTEINELIDNMDAEGGIDRFMVNRDVVHALVVDALAREEAALEASRHVVVDGVCHHFGDSKGAIHFEMDGIGYHLLPGGHVDTPRGRVTYLALDDVYEARQLGVAAAEIAQAITQLREGLLADADYENRSVREVLREHPLYKKLTTELAEIRGELIGKI